MTNDRISEDEIDLKELFITLWNKRIFILILTSIITLVSFVYVLMKNPKPIYSGNLLVEIGEYYTENMTPVFFDTSRNLKVIIEKKSNTDTTSQKGSNNIIGITFPKGSNNLILISSLSSEKVNIQKNIKNALDLILKRHENKSKLYDKFIMTKQIGNISISNKAINTPKKKLIVVVSFVTGFILSVFLVFLMNFIQGLKKESEAK